MDFARARATGGTGNVMRAKGQRTEFKFDGAVQRMRARNGVEGASGTKREILFGMQRGYGDIDSVGYRN